MPSADFCRPVRTDRSILSPVFGASGRPPEVSSTAFRTQPPNLQPVPLMDMDFVVSSQLVRHRMPLIRFLYIGSYVCSTLLSDPASRRRPCASLSLHLHQVVKRTFTFELSNMLGTLAVRTAVARCPPHRPVLARLTHTVPTLDAWRQSVRWDKDVECGRSGMRAPKRSKKRSHVHLLR
jgi:hypothetical protein